MSPVVLDRTYNPSPEVMVRVVGEESVVLDMASGRYLGMNEVGTRVWQLLEGGATPAAAVITLLDEFDVEEPTLRAHVETFVGELIGLGLVVV
jgi:Coenzyme PQQ synthesis protein D (PqqD)